MRFLLLTLLFSSGYAYQCGQINVTSTWSLPLSNATSNCWYIDINFAPNMYAKMYIRAINMGTYDSISVDYTSESGGRGQSSESDTFISNVSYAAPYTIRINTDPFNPTKMQFEVQVQVFPLKLGQSVLQSFSIGTNQPTGLGYFADFQKDGTYNLKTDSTMGYVQAAYIGNRVEDNMELWNIWVYCDGVFKYSMYDITYWFFLNPMNGSVVAVYIAEKPVALKGALVFNDFANYNNLYQPQNVYVPLNMLGETATYWLSNVIPDQGLDNALTIVGAKDGSTPFDIRSIKTDNSIGTGDPAYMSFSSGGVVRDHQNATRLDSRSIPFHVTGNLNTFYVTKGAGLIKITVSR